MTLLRHRSSGPHRDGCGFVLLTFVFSCLFLILNSALIGKLMPHPDTAPGVLAHPGFNQAVLFVGPVILIFVEWWLVDLIVGLVTPRPNADRLTQKRETEPRR